jgi:hypothetical protein
MWKEAAFFVDICKERRKAQIFSGSFQITFSFAEYDMGAVKIPGTAVPE